jgi:hypothetical protein
VDELLRLKIKSRIIESFKRNYSTTYPTLTTNEAADQASIEIAKLVDEELKK